eukprot:TRINITY_DN22454_c0_g1_i4.p1 TRINITY_DN22454_c0_g1~~TRINITY_DN22454_c0_g1_i4.p1  ORF type:complete len:263 (-),score=6.17 TRINITY_DN22454_c0_g1_i4:77-865(-)
MLTTKEKADKNTTERLEGLEGMLLTPIHKKYLLMIPQKRPVMKLGEKKETPGLTHTNNILTIENIQIAAVNQPTKDTIADRIAIIITMKDITSLITAIQIRGQTIVEAEAGKAIGGEMIHMDIVMIHIDIVMIHMDIVMIHIDIVMIHMDIVMTHMDIVMIHTDIVMILMDMVVIPMDIVMIHMDIVMIILDIKIADLDTVANQTIIKANQDTMTTEMSITMIDKKDIIMISHGRGSEIVEVIWKYNLNFYNHTWLNPKLLN